MDLKDLTNEERELAERLSGAKDAGEIRAIFDEAGYDVTLEDVERALDSVVKENSGEFDEADLELVTGGAFDWLMAAGLTLGLLGFARSFFKKKKK